MKNPVKGDLRRSENERYRVEGERYRTIQRVVSLVFAFGLICVLIGFALFLGGRTLTDVGVSTVGAWLLFIGGIIIVARIIYWIGEQIVGQGMEEMVSEFMIQFGQLIRL